MIITLKEYKKFYDKCTKFKFNNEESIFVDSNNLSQHVTYGLNKLNALHIILPRSKNLSGFRIKDLFILKNYTVFQCENKKIKIEGLPLIYNSKDYKEQYDLISLIETFLEKDNFNYHLNQFFDFLQRTNSFNNNKFESSFLFSEIVTLLRLLKTYPSIVDNWNGVLSNNATMDISESVNNPAIEIKSTIKNDTRIHSLSINQIHYFQTNEETLLASVIIYKDENGLSCRDICRRILSKTAKDSPGYKHIQSMLIMLINNSPFSTDLYNLQKTIDSIKFYSPTSTFNELVLNPTADWIKGGSINIDVEALPQSTLDL